MKIALTSFGLTATQRPSHLEDLFQNMPPVSMAPLARNAFLPDYAALLLADKVVLDAGCYDALIHRSHPLYSLVAESLKELHQQGFVELVDFPEILWRNRALMRNMLANDLESFEAWLSVLRESNTIWQAFFDLYSRYSLDSERVAVAGIMHDRVYPMASIGASTLEPALEALKGSSPSKLRELKRKPREALKSILSDYLKYVNTNLVIANALGVGFCDWADFRPFYQRKFLSVGQVGPQGTREANEVQKLFSVSFPEYAIRDTKAFLKIITDQRMESLRQLVQEAVDGNVVFDEAFARNTFKEVLGLERRAERYRTIVSYLTMPLDLLNFIPGVGAVIEKGIEVVTDKVLDRNLKGSYRWFYLLSETTEAGT